jgi:alpha-tubulin suppressor-like RCC1 family protein
MQCRSARLWTALTPVFAATIVAACGESLTNGPQIASISIISGTPQSGPIGSTLAQPFVVLVQDQSGVPVEGIVVTWQVTSGGGIITPSQSTSDANGQASATLRLGTTVGTNTVTARIDESASVVFTATATTAPPSSLIAAGGDAQSGVVAAQLLQDLVVKATDAVGNPKAGVVVSFAVTSGGGSLSASSAITDAAGLASVRWTLGTLAGPQTAIASVSGLAPITFTATARAANPQTITVTGNNQSGSPGAPLPDSLRVRLLDQFGNPVSGVTILWTPLAGSGSVSPSTSVTDATGRAATRWTLGSTGGPKFVVASGGGLSQTFTAGGTVLYSSVSGGGRSTCGITVDAVMLCWGYNGEGQLGIGDPPGGSGPVFAFPQPTATTGSLTFRQVVASLYHACAVTLASVGYCWGVNHDGRLGTNNVQPSDEPIQIFTPVSFRMVAVSRNHSCGLSLSDRVWCWGYAWDGQTGTGTPPPPPTEYLMIPTEVSGDPTLRFQAVVAGGQHACAITTPAMGSVAYCWGFNARSQLGDGSSATRFVPTLVSGGLTFKDVDAPIAGQVVLPTIAAGYAHTCALTSAGVAYCWGSNASGQLGAGAGSNSNVPVAVGGGLVFTAITAGEAHSCGLTAAGALYCWGNNSRGQLGDGTNINRNTPVLVSGGQVFRSLSAGDLHTCAVNASNISFCWGDNQFGQLGDGTLVSRLVPTRVAFQP